MEQFLCFKNAKNLVDDVCVPIVSYKTRQKGFHRGWSVAQGGIERKSNLFFSNSLLVEKGVLLLGYRQNFLRRQEKFSNSLNFTKRTHKPDQPLLSLPSPSCFSFWSQDQLFVQFDKFS